MSAGENRRLRWTSRWRGDRRRWRAAAVSPVHALGGSEAVSAATSGPSDWADATTGDMDGSAGVSDDGREDWANWRVGALTGTGVSWPPLNQASTVSSTLLPVMPSKRDIGDGTDRAPQSAIQRVAGDLFHRADMLAGDGAIDRADHRQMLQRIDDIQQVMKEAFVLVRRSCRGRSRGGRRCSRCEAGDGEKTMA